MSSYRRWYIPGSHYFFTVVTYHRTPWFAEKLNVDRLREAFCYARQKRPFSLDAIVVLPDHLHCLWTLQEEADFSTRWQLVKTHFSRQIAATKKQNGAKRVWQPRFWEHYIRDEEDLRRHLDYIHYNPVKHGYVNSAAHWPHSSFRKYLEHGFYESSWGIREPQSIADLDIE